ncbi:hypothetical protein DTO027B5_5046 [Paecilomyces variotii]|nr:hypothetical protein DTO169C6_5531 [Paecilomyces variotii]KAJ9257801.1 hypothetical protein DTO195F2_5433 [Paecilomyces variotii]KAJ9291941.1 hypothetical protein DTO021C3_381 [Paecilomyces variotii]KAJ9306450.1 hypothetical protein DTO217A2_3996 [Paecilomyces variotii]KAJ9320576.1 hypothetical protein DTO027B3_8427 [Paecilomyces variotii]
MTAATTSVGPGVAENGLNSLVHGHITMNMPRFHPIAINPHHSGAHDPSQGHYRHTPYPPPPVEQQPLAHPGPQGTPAPSGPLLGPQSIPNQLDQIEARLRQLEHEDAARMAARSHLLAIRKREDEEFRMITESAEAEEEELRRRRKRLKRESMGLSYNSGVDSPPPRATPPRRLSETNAATTLAFFKQQSPQEPVPATLPPPVAHIPTQPPPSTDPNGGHVRKKQKYTIKNVEAWGERHGRPISHDPAGRALWKRPSDGRLVYLNCPAPGCGKSDFVTLHGFMCHLTKKHKDRSLGSQSRALELCGTVFDPSAPLQATVINRASTEESHSESPAVYSDSDDDDDDLKHPYGIKREDSSSKLRSTPQVPSTCSTNAEPNPMTNGSVKQTISSILDNDTEKPRETATPAISETAEKAPSHTPPKDHTTEPSAQPQAPANSTGDEAKEPVPNN